ncbi:MAG: Tol-Pal system beta propeller repeat protein TolB [Gemmatimonadota bacterium]
MRPRSRPLHRPEGARIRAACKPRRPAHPSILALAALAALALGPATASAQQDVRVGIAGYVDEKINIAIDDVAPGTEAARTVAEILAFDLEFSLRFNVLEGRATAGVVRTASGIDYESWAIFGTEYLVKASLAPGGAGYAVSADLHNVPFQREIASLSFALPDAGSENFRAAVHQISNTIIKELTGEDGIANTRIAFASRRRGDKEIFVIDYDGQNPYRVTSLDTISMTPDWHPGGSEICFTTFARGNADLYCASAGGGQAQPLSTHNGLNMAPAWSPDGGRLALTLTKDGNAEIYSLDRSGRSLDRLTFNIGIDTSPTWSPNGRQIAFESDRTGVPQIYVMDAEGANVRQLSRGGEAHSPAWSPIGDRIAYVERVSGGFQIVTIDADGGGRQVLTSSGSNEDPSWSPDGLHIAFSSTRAGGSDIYTMDWDGQHIRRVTRGGGFQSPSWSPRLGER